MPTADDYSPLIRYDGQWVDSFNLNTDVYASSYRNGSFHASSTNGSTATISFRGTAIYIFGAKRPKNGFYTVSVDGGPPGQYKAHVRPWNREFQTPLFIQEGMEDTTHSVVLTNLVANESWPNVDIDFVTWNRTSDQSQESQIIDDLKFEYSDMWTSSTNVSGYIGSTAHSTTASGASARLIFDGSEIFLYGGVGPNHGMFKVQIDDQPGLTLNGTRPLDHTPTLLYTTSELDPGSHKIVVTNLDAGKTLDVDYAEVVLHPEAKSALPPSQAVPLSTGGIVGIVLGVVGGLVLFALGMWCLFTRYRRRNRGRYLVDLFAPGHGTEDSLTQEYRPVLGRVTGVIEPYVDASTHSYTSRSSTETPTPGGGVTRNVQPLPKGAMRPAQPPRSGPSASEPCPRPAQTRVVHEFRAHAGENSQELPPVYDEIVRSSLSNEPRRNRR